MRLQAVLVYLGCLASFGYLFEPWSRFAITFQSCLFVAQRGFGVCVSLWDCFGVTLLLWECFSGRLVSCIALGYSHVLFCCLTFSCFALLCSFFDCVLLSWSIFVSFICCHGVVLVSCAWANFISMSWCRFGILCGPWNFFCYT